MKDDVYLNGVQVAKALGLKMDEFLEMNNTDGAFIKPAGRDTSGRWVWGAKSISDWVRQQVSVPVKESQKEIPLVYIAGPYRAPTRQGIELNIQAARAVAVRAAQKGWAVICPHLNTAHMDEIAPELGDQFWLDATMEMMRRCDAIVTVAGWSESKGTKAELDEAEELEIPVFYQVDALPTAAEFLQDQEADRCAGCSCG